MLIIAIWAEVSITERVFDYNPNVSPAKIAIILHPTKFLPHYFPYCYLLLVTPIWLRYYPILRNGLATDLQRT